MEEILDRRCTWPITLCETIFFFFFFYVQTLCISQPCLLLSLSSIKPETVFVGCTNDKRLIINFNDYRIVKIVDGTIFRFRNVFGFIVIAFLFRFAISLLARSLELERMKLFLRFR